MKCPKCQQEFASKPDVVVETKPCECGMTREVRLGRLIAIVICCGILSLLAGCWMTHYYNAQIAGKTTDRLNFWGGVEQPPVPKK